MSAHAARSRQTQPPKEAVDFIASMLGGDTVRLISLDTTNPNGGRGGSLDSDQCAWLVRQLAQEPERGVIVASRHRSHELRNTKAPAISTPRILGDELVPLLLAHGNVLGSISGNRHRPSAIRHGVHEAALWEMTPSLLGFGCRAWQGLQRRRAVMFAGSGAAPSQGRILASV